MLRAFSHVLGITRSEQPFKKKCMSEKVGMYFVHIVCALGRRLRGQDHVGRKAFFFTSLSKVREKYHRASTAGLAVDPDWL
jgi:hypothetical protein